MLNNPFKGENNAVRGHSTHLTDVNPTYPTAKGGYSAQTPYTMGLKNIKTPIEKSQDKPTSLRLAINAMCFECVGSGFDPKPQNEIRNCQISACPLWNLRPHQKNKPTAKFARSAAGQFVSIAGIKNGN